MSENVTVAAKRSSAPLWIIIALCAAPMIAAYVAYYVWPPSGHVNYGDLIAPRSVADAELVTLNGPRIRIAELKGNWLMLVFDAARCDERCERKLVYTRQVRLAEGTEKERIERLWILTSDGRPDDALLKQHPELIVARETAGTLAKALPPSDTAADRIYVIDPLGNLMLSFPPDPDPRRMLKDMSRLLRHSKWK